MADRKKQESLFKEFILMDRIETQIHRRRKVKVFSSIQIEWDCSQPSGTEPSRIEPEFE